MHLLLTDHLTCPRCGPDFGLILLSRDVRDRRVLEGTLGCFNCREEYPVVEGVGDLRPPPRPELPDEGPSSGDDAEEALRLAALLGVPEGPGLLLLGGQVAAQARRIAARIEGIEVVGIHRPLEEEAEGEGVSRLRVGALLPFRTGVVRGVALEGAFADGHLQEGLRVLVRGGRFVLVDGSPESRSALESGGGEVLLATERFLVVQR